MPSRRQRLLASVLISAVAVALAAHIYGRLDTAIGVAPDFDHFWIAGRALAHGENPYHALRAAGAVVPLYYPLPAVFFMLPFGWLPLPLARLAVVALGSGLFTYVLSARGWWSVLWLASGPSLMAIFTGQWSPFLVAGIAIPLLRVLWAMKPSIGLALWAGWPTGWPLLIAALFWAASFVVDPTWPADWLQALKHSPHIQAPVLTLGGPILLLALLRWRHPEARFLAALACIPHVSALYDDLPLGLVPRTLRQMIAVVALSQLALILHIAPQHSVELAALSRGNPFRELVLIDFPALVLLLRREPGGEGPSSQA